MQTIKIKSTGPYGLSDGSIILISPFNAMDRRDGNTGHGTEPSSAAGCLSHQPSPSPTPADSNRRKAQGHRCHRQLQLDDILNFVIANLEKWAAATKERRNQSSFLT